MGFGVGGACGTWALSAPAGAGSTGLRICCGASRTTPGMAYSEGMKIIVVLAFVGILIALATAGHSMLRDGRDGQPKSRRMANALAVRVGLSVLLFVLILLSHWMGWIQPTGVPMGR